MKEKCDYCGQSQEEFYYPLKHPSRCLKKIEDEKNELRAERNNLLEQFPTNTKEHREYLIGLTKERDAALLQNGELREALRVKTATTENLEKGIEDAGYKLEQSNRLNEELQKIVEAATAFVQVWESSPILLNSETGGNLADVVNKRRVSQKRVEAPQKRMCGTWVIGAGPCCAEIPCNVHG